MANTITILLSKPRDLAAIIVPEPLVKSAVKAKSAGFNPEVFNTLAAPDFLFPFRNKFCLYFEPIINENGIAPII